MAETHRGRGRVCRRGRGVDAREDEPSNLRRDQQDQEITARRRRIRALERQLAEARKTTANEEGEEESASLGSSSTGNDDEGFNRWGIPNQRNRRPGLKPDVSYQTLGLKIDLPEFEGISHPNEFIDWLHTIERVFEVKNLNDGQKVKLVTIKLRKHASIWWEHVKTRRAREGKPKIQSWSKMKKKLIAKFLPAQYRQKAFVEYRHLNQRDMPVEQYTNEFDVLRMRCDVVEEKEQTSRGGSMANQWCFKCQGLGHLIADCPNQQFVTLVEEDVEPMYDDYEDYDEGLEDHLTEGEEITYAYSGESLAVRSGIAEAIILATDETAGHVVVQGPPEESIILNVLSATVDFPTCEPIRMSQKVDKTGERTLAVVTKADKAPEALIKKITADEEQHGDHSVKDEFPVDEVEQVTEDSSQYPEIKEESSTNNDKADVSSKNEEKVAAEITESLSKDSVGICAHSHSSSGVAAQACGLVSLEPTKIAEILKDRPSWFWDCRNIKVFTMFSAGSGGTVELLLIPFGYLIRPYDGGGPILHIVGHLNFESCSAPEILRPLYESSKDVDGTLVWSTGTANKFVLGSKILATGSCVLHDIFNQTVWQSFDHPTDALLPCQKLRAGQRLVARVSSSNWTEGASTGSKISSSTGIIIGAAVGGSVIAIIALLIGVYAFWQKKRAEDAAKRSDPFASWDSNKHSGVVPQLTGARLFSFEELKKWTNNFSETNDIGCGGYGKVYRGTLPNRELVAIKKALQGSMQGAHEFKTEIELLSRVHHKNVVGLTGFCCDQAEQMLVYEYIPNSPLKDALSGKTGIKLDWMRRLRIAVGAARGLQYLHDLVNPPIIHRDVKSNNILLDDRLNARVADFGLSKLLGDSDRGHTTAQVNGTMGYMDPEYYMTNQLTEKSDVYSFGVVVPEIITGKIPIDKVKNAMNKTKDMYNLQEILDPAVRSGSTPRSLEKFVDLALRCVEEEGANRPTMSEVVKEIENIMEMAGLNPNADSASSSATYEGPNKGKNHPYTDESLFVYSGAYPPSKVEPK